MPFTLIPFLLLVVPILEITVFILVGQWIGLGWTLALVVLSAVSGTILLRRQGFSTLARIRAETQAGRLPGRDLVHGMMIMVAGVLLLTPGFVTDAVGLLLFVPQVRERAWAFLRDRVTVVVAGQAAGARPTPHPGRPAHGPDVVDLSDEEFRRRSPDGSPWTAPDETPGNRTLH
ncbi:FxsA family protein [Mangrovibrevibacter kandeliae]|uniref:FxsA family protein n=1 Tax=Mangrovibrevibacter kandeliae TaxID=2968473 RepID=UPI0021172C6D|nr:FxsA family protein [Aurantimonas sp. CSK15Z-1]MCQ8782326.1 membrane protein FxsA [Aurantimonas sp. CSK15Z-1]